MFSSWSDKRRQIFRYWDGRKWLRADPAIIQQKMQAHPTCNFDTDSKIMFKQDQFGIDSYNNIITGVKDVFGVRDIDAAGGLTEIEQLGLLQSYWEFLAKLKKNFSLRPTLSQTSESAPSSASATQPPLASVSTGSEPFTDVPK